MKKAITSSLVIIFNLMPLAALAQGLGTPVPALDNVVRTLTRYAQGVIVTVSVLFIVYAAFLYLTSQGDPAATTKARNVIIYAVVGIAVALLAEVLVRIAQQIFGTVV